MGEQVSFFVVVPVVAADVKQRRMQTVTVRGVSFRVDSRGTKLQRVQSSVSHPGTARFVLVNTSSCHTDTRTET